MKSWEKFERLVAAVNLAADKDATVKWDDTVDGRQFDVTIRYKKGLYDFLIVIECKDFATPIPIEKVEAFATKSSSVGANRAILASSSGFQSGAIQSARENNIILYKVSKSEDLNLPVGVKIRGKIPVNVVTNVKFHFTAGGFWELPEHANESAYYLKKLRVDDQLGKDFIDTIVHTLVGDETMVKGRNFHFDLEQQLLIRGEGEREIPQKFISSVTFTVTTEEATELEGETIYDPSMLLPQLYAEDVINGTKDVFDLLVLPYRLNDPVEIGAFYEHPMTGKRFYIENITGDMISLWLVESFQHGMLVQAKMTQDIKCFDYSQKIRDANTISRLKRRVAQLSR